MLEHLKDIEEKQNNIWRMLGHLKDIEHKQDMAVGNYFNSNDQYINDFRCTIKWPLALNRRNIMVETESVLLSSPLYSMCFMLFVCRLLL